MEEVYRNAGYQDEQWHTPSEDSSILGVYNTDDGEAIVEFLPVGPSTLPEYKISFENGRAVTILCENQTREYLRFHDANKTKRKDAKFKPPRIKLDHWSEDGEE